MLRITTAESGEGATKYFDSALGRSDYYGVELGMWGGRGAERLGLEHEVSRDDFVALAMNKVPGTLEKLTVRDKETRRAGYDFCFSVPKSISIYLAETGDKAVERMIHESFRETMADVEERMETRVRAGDSDYDRTTGNMVYASFVHRETRPIDGAADPHYHIHGFTFNATYAVTRLGKLNLTISQKRDPINYDVGQVIEFHRRAKGGFKSGERWEVVRAELGAAVVVAKAGEEKLLPLDQANTFDLYVTEQISLATGDAVRITKNFRAGGSKFRNNELCTVKAIDGEKITLSDDRVIDSEKALHLDQGIAVTSHASQGKTVDQVIVSAPVPAFSQVNSAQFYVSMSRARHAMHLFTDSFAALREAVCRPSERLSPMELESRYLAAESPPWTNHPPIERQRTNDIEIENEYERER